MNAKVTDFKGFSFDASSMANEVSVITSIIEEYRPAFACGQFTQERYDEFIRKLKDAGVNEYIALIQSQLDEWIASK